MESVNRRFSPEGHEGGIGLSEDLLGGSGDSLGFGGEGVLIVELRRRIKSPIK